MRPDLTRPDLTRPDLTRAPVERTGWVPGEPASLPDPGSPERDMRPPDPDESSAPIRAGRTYPADPGPDEIGLRRGAHRSAAPLLLRLRAAGADRLPATLRGGVFRPSPGAVLGLALLGLLAVAVGAWFVWQARPSQESTTATTVLDDGAPVRGGLPDPPPAEPDGAASSERRAGSTGSTAPGAAETQGPAAGSPDVEAVPSAGSLAARSGSPGAASEVVVHVAGRVLHPGVVRLPGGSRVVDAVAAAGGVTAGADAARINLARPLVDGEQVFVLAEGESAPDLGPGSTGPPAGAGAPAPPGGGLAVVDLNTATLADLDTLPGVGPVLAQRILDWRKINGRFTSVDELREITGVGEKRLADLRGKVTV